MIDNLHVRIPKNALMELNDLLIPQDTPIDSIIQLIITVPSQGNLREFAAYLALVDRFYGRITDQSLHSYSHKRSVQLEYSDIRIGSCRIVLAQSLIARRDSELVPLYLLLKYLPYVRPEAAQAVYRIAASMEQYQDRRLAKLNRKQLLLQMPLDPILQRLDSRRLHQVVAFLDSMYAKEMEHLAAPIRFATSSVRSVDLLVPSINQERYSLRNTVVLYSEPTEPVAMEDWDVLR